MKQTLTCISLIIVIVLLTIVIYNWYTARCTKEAKSTTTSAFIPDSQLKPLSKKLDEFTLQRDMIGYGEDTADAFTPTLYDPSSDELGRSIKAQQDEYIAETYKYSLGPDRMNVELDNNNDLVPRLGLRRIDYNINYDDSARTTPSEIIDEVSMNSRSPYIL